MPNYLLYSWVLECQNIFCLLASFVSNHVYMSMVEGSPGPALLCLLWLPVPPALPPPICVHSPYRSISGGGAAAVAGPPHLCWLYSCLSKGLSVLSFLDMSDVVYEQGLWWCGRPVWACVLFQYQQSCVPCTLGAIWRWFLCVSLIQ